MNLENSFKPPLHSDYLSMWSEITPQIEDEDINRKYETISKIIGHYAALNNQMMSVYNMKTQRVLFISDNYHSVSGYTCTLEEYQKWSSVFFLRDLPITQSWFIIQVSLWFKTSIQPKIKKFQGKKSLHLYLHNFVTTPPNSKKKYRLCILAEALEMADNGSPVIFMVVKKDAESLIKDDGTWWAEFFFNQHERYHYHEDKRKFVKGSILSEREIEVLQLIKQGVETKNIAEQLDLSTHTVDKHRKNMLERTGAKDTSMLLKICELAKII